MPGVIKHFKQRNKHSSECGNAEVRISRSKPFIPYRPWESEYTKEEAENYSTTEKSSLCDSDQVFSDQENFEVSFPRESERHDENGGNTERCQYCPATFTRKDNLTRHRKSKHPQNRFQIQSPKCPFCNKKLSRQDAVQRHMTTCPRNPGSSVQIMTSPDLVHVTKWSERER